MVFMPRPASQMYGFSGKMRGAPVWKNQGAVSWMV
jgi:hypothetical protein